GAVRPWARVDLLAWQDRAEDPVAGRRAHVEQRLQVLQQPGAVSRRDAAADLTAPLVDGEAIAARYRHVDRCAAEVDGAPATGEPVRDPVGALATGGHGGEQAGVLE